MGVPEVAGKLRGVLAMSEFGFLPPEPALSGISAVSPSRFGILHRFAKGEGCALREVMNAPPALPYHPAAAMGNVIHTFLDAATKGLTSGVRQSAENMWGAAVESVSNSLQKQWFNAGILPLHAAVRSFDQKKHAAFRLAAGIEGFSRGIGGAGGGLCTEEDVSTRDGMLKGRIDYACCGESGWVVKDYKTGAVSEEGDDGMVVPKEAYRIQMLLYAAIFFDKYGEWPHKLVLVSLAGEDIEIKVDEGECEAIRGEVKGIVERINAAVREGRGKDLVRPRAWSPGLTGGCGGCGRRPLCGAYKTHAKTQSSNAKWPRDMWGKVLSVQGGGNGRQRIWMQAEHDVRDDSGNRLYPQMLELHVLDSVDRHPALARIREGSWLEVYDFLKRQSAAYAEDGNLTTLYLRKS